MEESESKRMTPRLLGAAAAVMIVSLLAIGALTGITPLATFQKTQDAHEATEKPLEVQRQPVRPEHATTMPVCATCGTVESIRPMEVEAQVAPAGAGHDSARQGAKRTVYRVTVRMDDGSYRTISQPVEPGYGVGEKVRVIDSSIRTGG